MAVGYDDTEQSVSECGQALHSHRDTNTGYLNTRIQELKAATRAYAVLVLLAVVSPRVV
jgi:hypothetical protein